MQKLASEHTYFPGDVSGFFGVLHTWGRTMNYHPHIHYIVPGGAFDSHDHSWNASQKAFYLPIRVLSKLVKHRIYNTLKKEGLLHLLPHTAWNQDGTSIPNLWAPVNEVSATSPPTFSVPPYRIKELSVWKQGEYSFGIPIQKQHKRER